MAYKLIGKDFTPPDVAAKVTGRAKYAEDFRADGMVFAKLLLSPMPHARVRNIDASEALAMDGVFGILTADDLPEIKAPNDPVLTNEPVFVGQPILAVAAIDETTAAAAVEKVKVDFEPLPFAVDPLDSLFPGGPNARTDGNVGGRIPTQEVKWTARDFAAIEDGQMPLGEAALEWQYGDVESAFANAKLVVDESFMTQGHPHHCMEPRTAFAYWENGKVFVYGSSQSQAFVVPGLARYIGVDPSDVIYVAEFCGGGFGSKGGGYPIMSLPAHFSKKINRPVMMRMTRAEEYYIGVGRPAFQGRVKIGFAANGRIQAIDLFIVQDTGPNRGGGDYLSANRAVSLVYQPENMRYRGLPVFTNTAPRGAQRGPGENQIACAIEPLLDKAAAELGVDRVELRKINAPGMDGLAANNRTGERGPVTSARLADALDIGAERFGYADRMQRSGARNGSKVTGIGVGQAFHTAGSNGFDGMARITPDGKIHLHTGVGNLGTYSYASTVRVVPEMLDAAWESCEIHRGDTRNGTPWTLGQFGSNTSFTESRANYAAAMDTKQKLLEIAAMDLGGAADDYELKSERVVSKADASKSMSFADAAKLAVELGGKYSGQEVPEDINDLTKQAVARFAGTGLIGVAKDIRDYEGITPCFTITFVEVEVDTETGKTEVIEMITVGDSGTITHPQSYATQIQGGSVQGIGMAMLERYVYDPQNGMPATHSFHSGRIPSYLDVPAEIAWGAVDKPDPANPVGIKGVGEPPVGSAASAMVSAVSNALGGLVFARTPIVPDMIINAVAGRPQSSKPLSVNTQ